MGAAAHETVADRAHSLPRRVSSLAERLKGARSNLAAQPREERVPSGAGRAETNCGGPRSKLGTVSLTHHVYGLKDLPEFRRHGLDVLR